MVHQFQKCFSYYFQLGCFYSHFGYKQKKINSHDLNGFNDCFIFYLKYVDVWVCVCVYENFL